MANEIGKENEAAGKCRTAGAVNLIGAALCLLYLAVFFICLYSGVIGKDVGDDAQSGLGFAVFIIVGVPLFLFTFAPICVIDVVWQLAFGIRLLNVEKRLEDGREALPARGAFILSGVLKILSVVLFAFGALLTYGIAEVGGSVALAVAFAVGALLLAAYEIVLFVMERKARRSR